MVDFETVFDELVPPEKGQVYVNRMGTVVIDIDSLIDCLTDEVLERHFLYELAATREALEVCADDE